MAELKRPAPGQIGWIDLTVPEAQALCAFYQHVTGWTPSPVAMGGLQRLLHDRRRGRVRRGHLPRARRKRGHAACLDDLHYRAGS